MLYRTTKPHPPPKHLGSWSVNFLRTFSQICLRSSSLLSNNSEDILTAVSYIKSTITTFSCIYVCIYSLRLFTYCSKEYLHHVLAQHKSRNCHRRTTTFPRKKPSVSASGHYLGKTQEFHNRSRKAVTQVMALSTASINKTKR